MEQYFKVFVQYSGFVSFVLLDVAFCVRWLKKADLSAGHFLAGLLCTISLVFFTLVLGLVEDNNMAMIFLPVAGLGLAAWVQYCNWYNEKYPIPESCYPPVPGPGVFVPKSRIVRYLVGHGLDNQKAWVQDEFKAWGGIITFAVLVIFGFSQTTNQVVVGDHRVAAERALNTQVVKAVGKTVTQQVNTANQKSTDTLQAALLRFDDKLDSTNEKVGTIAVVAEKNKAKIDVWAKQTGKLNKTLERQRRSTTAPAPLQQKASQFMLPEVKPYTAPKLDKRGRRVSEAESNPEEGPFALKSTSDQP